MQQVTKMSALPDEQERLQQIEEARRLSREEGFAPRRTLSVRPTVPKKSSGAPKGHEAFLKGLESSGAKVRIEKCNGTVVVGTIKCSDKYTVSVRQGPDEYVVDRVIFKHDISEFSALAPRSTPKVEEVN